MADNKEMLEEEFDEEEMEIITLVDMEGKDVEFYHLATIDYKRDWFVILQPVEKLPEIADDEVLIYKLGMDKEDGSDTFEPVEDDDILNAVFEEYVKACEEDECGCGCGDCDCDCDEGCDCDGECDCEKESEAEHCKCCDCEDKA